MYRMFQKKFKEEVATTSSFLPISNEGVKPGAVVAILWFWEKVKGLQGFSFNMVGPHNYKFLVIEWKQNPVYLR